MTPRSFLFCACAIAGIAAAGFTSVDAGQLRWTVLDSETGQPVPCRIHLKDSGGKPVLPAAYPAWKDHFVRPGIAELDLAPGRYTYEIDRGPEYQISSGQLAIENGAQTMTNRLNRLITLSKEGWWSGDMHVHR